jgi:hypothetical protein
MDERRERDHNEFENSECEFASRTKNTGIQTYIMREKNMIKNLLPYGSIASRAGVP